MKKIRRRKVSFRAIKYVSKPVRVRFYTHSGKEVSFRARRKVKTPVKVEFYTRSKSKRTRRKK